ncbi:hypothetical protein OAO87_01895 [bacterium]|nr:hypothetical protein [bacterium]
MTFVRPTGPTYEVVFDDVLFTVVDVEPCAYPLLYPILSPIPESSPMSYPMWSASSRAPILSYPISYAVDVEPCARALHGAVSTNGAADGARSRRDARRHFPS